MGIPDLLTIIIVFAVFFLIFLAIRSILLWYWKIDKIVVSLESQSVILKKQNQLIEQQTQLIKEFKEQMGNTPTDPNQPPQA